MLRGRQQRRGDAKKSNRSFGSCLPAARLASQIFISFLNSVFFKCYAQKFKLKLYF
jgi:hypothetical protein